MMEAMRILKQSGVKLRRTVRIGLWGGEEQGLMGSSAYITQHFADRTTMALKPGHAKMAGLLQHGQRHRRLPRHLPAGERGRRRRSSRPGEAVREHGHDDLDDPDTGSTDHTSFDRVGLPGFQFIQDPVEYSTRTHHTT